MRQNFTLLCFKRAFENGAGLVRCLEQGDLEMYEICPFSEKETHSESLIHLGQQKAFGLPLLSSEAIPISLVSLLFSPGSFECWRARFDWLFNFGLFVWEVERDGEIIFKIWTAQII